MKGAWGLGDLKFLEIERDISYRKLVVIEFCDDNFAPFDLSLEFEELLNLQLGGRELVVEGRWSFGVFELYGPCVCLVGRLSGVYCGIFES